MSDATSRAQARTQAHDQVLAVLLDDRLLTFTRVVGLLRRRQFSVHSVAVGPAAVAGLSRLTVVLHADEATAARAVEYLRHVVGVRDAVTFAVQRQVSRELALIKVRAPETGLDELLGVARHHGCAVVDEAPGVLVLEVSGPGPSVGACLDALRPFGVLDVARTGTVVVDTMPYAIANAADAAKATTTFTNSRG